MRTSDAFYPFASQNCIDIYIVRCNTWNKERLESRGFCDYIFTTVFNLIQTKEEQLLCKTVMFCSITVFTYYSTSWPDHHTIMRTGEIIVFKKILIFLCQRVAYISSHSQSCLIQTESLLIPIKGTIALESL